MKTLSPQQLIEITTAACRAAVESAVDPILKLNAKFDSEILDLLAKNGKCFDDLVKCMHGVESALGELSRQLSELSSQLKERK